MPVTLPAGFAQLDVAIVALIVLSGLLGIWRGLVREVLSIATLVLAIVAIRLYGQILALQFSGFIETGAIRLALASALLFFGVMLIGTGLIALIQRLLSFTGLRLVDRLAGGAFGVARGALVVMLCVYFAEPFFGGRAFWVESQGIGHAKRIMEWGAAYVRPVEPVNGPSSGASLGPAS